MSEFSAIKIGGGADEASSAFSSSVPSSGTSFGTSSTEKASTNIKLLFNQLLQGNFDRCIAEGKDEEQAHIEATFIANELVSSLTGESSLSSSSLLTQSPSSSSPSSSTSSNLLLTTWPTTSSLNVDAKLFIPLSSGKPEVATAAITAPSILIDDLAHLPAIVVVLVGLPGCGKTTFSRSLMDYSQSITGAHGEVLGRSFAWICQDALGSRQKCTFAARQALERGMSVIIDRTNVDALQRSNWTNLASEAGVACLCVILPNSNDKAYCIYMATQRGRDELHPEESNWNGIINGFANNYTEPAPGEEGFYEVIKVNAPNEVPNLIRRLSYPTLDMTEM